MHIPTNSRSGFTLVEILIVVAVIGLLLSIALPNYVKTRKVAQTTICIENLTQIESAKQIFGVEVGKKNGDEIQEEDLIGPTLYIKKMPECPAGGKYDLGAIGENATCTRVDLGHKLGGGED